MEVKDVLLKGFSTSSNSPLVHRRGLQGKSSKNYKILIL